MHKKILLPLIGIFFTLITNTGYSQTSKLDVKDISWPSPVQLNVGDVNEFVYRIKNIGLSSNLDTIVFQCIRNSNIKYLFHGGHPMFYLRYHDSVLSTTVTKYFYNYDNTDTLYHLDTLGLNIIDSNMLKLATGKGHLAFGDSVILHIPYLVTTCSSNVPGKNTFFKWVKKIYSDTVPENNSVSVEPGTPLLRASAVVIDSASFCASFPKHFCNFRFNYKNHGTKFSTYHAGNAQADSLRIYMWCDSRAGSIDVSSIKINDTTVNSSHIILYNTGNYHVYVIDLTNYPAGANGHPFGYNTICDMNGKNFADGLAEDSTFYITAKMLYDSTSCQPFVTDASPVNLSTIYYPVVGTRYTNMCYTDPYDSLLRLPSANLPGGDAAYEYQTSTSPFTSATVPPDITGSSPDFNFIICPHFFQSWTPFPFNFDCPDPNWSIAIPLPRGYHLNTASSLLTFKFPSPDTSSSAIYSYNDSLRNASGCNHDTTTCRPLFSEHYHLLSDSIYDTVFVNLGKLHVSACGSIDFNLLSCINVPLELDCPGFGSKKLYSATDDQLSFYLVYTCDSACVTCQDTLTSASAITYHHCPGSCTSIPFTDSIWSFRRTNLGSTNEDSTMAQYYSTCNPPYYQPGVFYPLTNTSLLNIESAYPGDQILAYVAGGYDSLVPSSYANEYLQIRYSTLVGSQNLFELDPDVQSYFILRGFTGSLATLNGRKLILPPYAPVYTDTASGALVEMNFSLDSAIKNTDSALYRTAWKTDTVGEYFSDTAYIHLRVVPAPVLTVSYGVYPLNLRTEFMCKQVGPNVSGDTVHSCDSWGAKFNIYRPGDGWGFPGIPVNYPNCDTFSVAMGISAEPARAWSIGGSDFPYEFRPYYSMDSTLIFNIPPGYVLSSLQLKVGLDNHDNNSIDNHFSGGYTTYTVPITHYYRNNLLNNPDSTTKVVLNGLNNSCWPLIDQKTYPYYPSEYVYLNLQPLCTAPSKDTLYCTTGVTLCTQQPDPNFQVKLGPSTFKMVLEHQNPITSLSLPATTNDYTNLISFTFNTCDISSYDMNDGWVAFENFNGYLLNIGSATLVDPNSHVVYTGYRYSNADSGVIFNIGYLNLRTCDTLVFSAYTDPNSKSCPPPVGGDTGKVLIRFGNICTGILKNPDSTKCQDNVDTLYYNIYPTSLQLTNNGYSPVPVSLCGGMLTDSLTIVSGDYGSITDPIFWVEPPVGTAVDSIVFTYPCPGSNHKTVTGSDTTKLGGVILGWHLDHVLHIKDLPGTLEAKTSDSNQVCLKVYMKMSCKDKYKNYIKYFATGYSTCSILISATDSILPNVDSLCFPVSISATTPICKGDSTNATASASGGISPYTYLWSTGATTSSIKVPAGTYSVIVKDSNGCRGIDSVTILQFPAASLKMSNINVSCNGGSNGTATVTATGGTTPYTYLWNPSGQTTGTITGLSIGIYTVTVTDSNGCKSKDSVTITQPATLSLTMSNTNVSCNGGSNGAATVKTTGGTIPYTYSWNPSGQTNATATGLSAGIYTVTVTDSNSCTAIDSIIISQPLVLSLSMSNTNVTCNGGSNGTVTVTAFGGTTPYTYLWSIIGQTNSTATGLSIGTYTVTVTDSNGCVSVDSVTIVQPLALSLSVANTNVSCNGGSNGTATVTATGGTIPYTYSWSPHGGTNASATGLSIGTYTVTVTDSNGCMAVDSATIAQPLALSLSISDTDITCNGDSNGHATVMVTGGVSPYTYLWNPSGYTNASISGLTIGTYTITVTDSNGCVAIDSVIITQPPVLTAIIINLTPNCDSIGSLRVLAIGGTSPYTYQWSNTQTTDTISGLSAGIYAVTVTDSNNCSVTINDTLKFNLFPSTLVLINDGFSPNPISLCGDTLTEKLTIISTNLDTVSNPIFWVSNLTGDSIVKVTYTYPCNSQSFTGDGTAAGGGIAGTGGGTSGGGTAGGGGTGSGSWSPYDTVTYSSSGSITGYGWILNRILHIHGLPGRSPRASDDSNTICVTVKMVLNCDYNTADSIRFYVTGSSICGVKDSAEVAILPYVNSACCHGGHCYDTNQYDAVIHNQSASALGVFDYTCKKVLIIGTYNVDANVNFWSSDVQVAPGGLINVTNNSKLSITQGPCGTSHVHGVASCDSMWRGIFIDTGSQFYTIDEPLIEDADTAVFAINSSSAEGLFTINHTTFNKNFKDIVVTPCPGRYQGYSVLSRYTCRDYSSLFISNPFAEVTDLNWESFPVTTLISPHAGQRTSIGWEIDTVRKFVDSMRIVMTTLQGGKNTFDNLMIGILSQNSNLVICSDTFQNINYWDYHFPAIFAYGKSYLDGRGDTLIVGGTVSPYHENVFRNVTTGVYALEGFHEIFISGNKFHDNPVTAGMYAVNIQGANYPSTSNAIYIQADTISNFYTGIEVGMKNNVNTIINRNTIKDSLCAATTGIAINEISPYAKYVIDSNYITVLNSAIYLNGLQHANINNNSITLDNYSPCPPAMYTGYGVETVSGDTNFIGCNTLSTGGVVNTYTGIYESQEQIDSIVNNGVTGLYAQIQFNSSPYTGDNVWHNTLSNGDTLIQTTSGAMAGAVFGSLSDAAQNGFSSFICDANIPSTASYCFVLPSELPSCTHPNPLPASVGSNPCPPTPNLHRAIRRHGLIDVDSSTIAYMKHVAQSQIVFPVLQDTNTILAKEGVLKLLWENQYLLTDTTFRNFNDSMSQSPMGQILAIDTAMVSRSLRGNFSSLLNTIASITPNNSIEQNMKIATSGYLTYMLQDGLNPQQLVVLQNVANRCPNWDGSGVYMARALLSLDGVSNIAYSNDCGQAAGQHKPTKNKKDSISNLQDSKFVLYPNPNNGGFTIEYKLNQGQVGELIIYNAVGEKVAAYQLLPNVNKMNIANTGLSNGIYFYSISIDNSIVKRDKLVIIK